MRDVFLRRILAVQRFRQNAHKAVAEVMSDVRRILRRQEHGPVKVSLVLARQIRSTHPVENMTVG